MSGRVGLMLALALVAQSAFTQARAQTSMPARAYYWNVGDYSSLSPKSDADRIALVKRYGATEVHVWLNDNRPTPACGYTFQYVEYMGGPLWKADRLEVFSRALQAAGLKVVFILSPDLRTTSYIASLSAVGGPLTVASRVGNVDIELDIEGNGAQAKPCPGDGLDIEGADKALVAAVRKAVPGAALIVSTTKGYDQRHPTLMATADAISPQLYGDHFAYTLTQATTVLDYFRSAYPAKPLWPGLSVECSVGNEAAGHCSEAIFDSEVGLLADRNTKAPGLVSKYVVWGEREARACPAKPLCSTFAATYLSGSTPH